jgi:hypothetical protein
MWQELQKQTGEGTLSEEQTDLLEKIPDNCPQSVPSEVTTDSEQKRKSKSKVFIYDSIIREKLEGGQNAKSIYQDLYLEQGYRGNYESVKRYVRKLRHTHPKLYARIETPPGLEAQVDFGLGAPGVRKTHLAAAISLEAIQKGFRVFYRSIFDVAREVNEESEQKVLDNYIKPELLVIDELGMKKLAPYTNDLLLEIFHRRYRNGSTLIASNRPIEDWGKIFGDNATVSAILDRLLENIHYLKIKGKSYRLKNLKGEK